MAARTIERHARQRGITAMLRCLSLCAIGACSLANAPAAEGKSAHDEPIMAPDEGVIRSALQTIRAAALASEPDTAAGIFAEELVLVSQSGKVYGRDAALFDLGNGFEEWDNSEVAVRLSVDRATVTYINARTREGLDPAKFRVMQVWEKRGDAHWVIVAQSSVRLPAQ